MEANNRLNFSAGIFSVLVALVLVVAKLWALGETGSLSVAASLADSGLDLLVSVTALAAIFYAARPADDDHAFGHGSAEDIAALGQSLFILAAAAVVAWAAVARLLDDTPPPLMAEGRGIAVMAGSIVLTLALVLWQRRVAARTGSKVVRADSLHYLGDLVPAVGAILALWASRRYGIHHVDSFVALAAATLMVPAAISIGRAAFDALMDRRADPAMIASIEAIVRDWPGVHGFHDLKTRTAGPKVFVNIHIELDGGQTLREAHAIGAALRRAIIAAHPEADVIVHKDPVGEPRHPDDPRGRG